MGKEENLAGKSVVADLCRLIGARLDQILDGKHDRDWMQGALDSFKVRRAGLTTEMSNDGVKWAVPIFTVVHQETKASLNLSQVDAAISYLNSIPEKDRVQPGAWSILWDRLFGWKKVLDTAILANSTPVAVHVATEGRKRAGLEFDHKVKHRADFNPFALGNMEKFSDITARAELEARQKDEEEPIVAGLKGSRERRAKKTLDDLQDYKAKELGPDRKDLPPSEELRKINSDIKETRAELREAREAPLYFEDRTDDTNPDEQMGANVGLPGTVNSLTRPAGRCAVCGRLVGDSPRVRLVPVMQTGNTSIPHALPDAMTEICEACSALSFWTVPNPLRFKVASAPEWHAGLTAVERQVVFLKDEEGLTHTEIAKRLTLPGAHTVTRILQTVESKRAAFYRGNTA